MVTTANMKPFLPMMIGLLRRLALYRSALPPRPKIIGVVVITLTAIRRVPPRHAEDRKRLQVARLGVSIARLKNLGEPFIDIGELLLLR